MVKEVSIRDVFVFIFMQHLSNEDSDAHTPFDSCHSETDCFSRDSGYRVTGQSHSLIGEGTLGLSGISTCYIDAAAFELVVVDDKGLEFEDGIDVVIHVLQRPDSAPLAMCDLTLAVGFAFTEKGRDLAVLGQTDPVDPPRLAAEHPSKTIHHRLHLYSTK